MGPSRTDFGPVFSLHGKDAHPHACIIYDDLDAYRRVAAGFVKEGLDHHEKCIMAVDQYDQALAVKDLAALGLDVDALLAQGQLAIINVLDSYAGSGGFDPERTIDIWKSSAKQALAEGYQALRVVGEATFSLGGPELPEKLIYYENIINEVLFKKIPFKSLCVYDKRLYPPEIIKGAIKAHPILFYNDEMFTENIHYIPPETYFGSRKGHEEIDLWLANVRRNNENLRLLKESNERFELAMRFSNDGLWDWDLTHEKIYFSSTWKKMLGYRDDEIENDFSEWQRLTKPEYVDKTMAVFREVVEKKRDRFEAEFPMRHKDGHWVDILSRANVVFDDSGKPVRMVGTHVDISPLKRAEEALRESEQRYRMLSDVTLEGIFIHKDAIVRDVNASLMRLLGYSREELIGRNLLDLAVHAEDRKIVRQNILKDYAEPYVIRVIRKNGDIFYAEIEARNIQSRGETLRVAAVRDITERVRAEEARRRSERKWRNILVNTPQIGISLDTRGRINFANKHFLSLTGWTEEEVIGQDWFNLCIPEELRDEVKGLFHKVMSGKEPLDFTTYENDIVIRGGERRTVNWSNVLTRDENGTIRDVTCLGIDLTERYLSEKVLRESEQRFRSFVENANDIVYALSPEGVFTYISPNWVDFIGEPAQAAVGKPFDVYVHPDDVHLCRDFLETVLATRQKQSTVEYRVRHCSGSWRWHVSNGSPLTDAQGEVTGYTGIARDITERKRAEEQLRETSDRLKGIVDNSPMLICEFDLEGRYLLVNKAVCAFYRLPEQALVGKTFAEVLPADVAEKFMARVAQVVKAQRPIAVEDIVPEKPAKRFFNTTLFPLLDAAGNIRAVGAIAHDITDRKVTEKQLLESLDLLNNLARLVPGVIYQYRLFPDGRSAFPYSSPGMNDIYEVSPEQVREDASVVFSRLHPEDHDRVAETIFESARTLETFHCEFRVVLPRQGLRWRWSQAKPQRTADGGTLWHGIIVDITDRKNAEEELSRQNRFTQTILDNLPIGLAVNHMEKGTATYINAEFEEVYGWPKEELRNIDSFFRKVYPDPGYRRKIKTRILEDIASGDPERMYWDNVEVTAKDGSKRIVAAKNIPLAEQHIMISTVQDQTPRIRAEQERQKYQEQLTQAQKMESVGRLAGGVAHDYNNMLSVIVGYTELALENMQPHDRLYTELTEIYNAARRSVDITRQLLAFARKQTIDPKVVDLNAVLESMLRIIRRLIGEDINLSWHPGKNLWHVKIDPAQVDQILANLCVNARDAITGVGKIVIETRNVTFDETYCQAHADMSPGAYVLLAVSDDGCGMDDKTASNIFEPFFTTKQVDEGTGLGLATVYGIVKQNNGLINVYSEPGEGTTFKIYIPRHDVEGRDRPTEPSAKAPASKGEAVLLVEDEAAIMRMAQMMLRRLGYEVLAAATPSQAVELVQTHVKPIDLLITDVVMPEMNGRELSEHLRTLYPELKTLFMSGYTANFISHRGVLEEGMNFIQKPFSMSDLGVKIRQVLKTV